MVAVWGAGPVGQFAMDSARLLGAEKVIAIDKEPYRLQMAAEAGYTHGRLRETSTCDRTLLELTGGRGPDKCIDAVGMEATHGSMPIYAYDRAKQAARLETDRPYALRQAIIELPQRRGRLGHRRLRRVRGQVPGRGVDEPGADPAHRPVPRAALHEAAARAHREGRIDPTRIITHTLPLEQAPHGYDIFKHKQDNCEKVVLKP